MPLPTPKSVWPPEEYAHITAAMQEWETWYSGSTTSLAAFYGSTSPAKARPSQYAGGIVGRVSRWFWGEPTSTQKARDSRIHVPVAADIATTAAAIVCGGGTQFTLTGEVTDEQRDEFTNLVEANGVESLVSEIVEIGAIFGGCGLRVTWTETAGARLDVVQPDAIYATWGWGGAPTEVTFVHVLEQTTSEVWRYAESHTPGRIEHALYQGTRDNVGHRVPLTERPETAGLTVDAGSGIDTGIDVMTAYYVPNLRPQRRWRTDPIGKNLGRPDIDGIEPIFDGIDETWSSWKRDERLAKARMVIPDALTQARSKGHPVEVNLDDDFIVPLPSANPEDFIPTLVQPDIRTVQHGETLHALLRQAWTSAGISPATVGLSDAVAVTATEVRARERLTLATRAKKIAYLRPVLAQALYALQAVNHVKFDGPEPVTVSVDFGDYVAPDPNDVATRLVNLNAAGAVSLAEKVRAAHPEWTPERQAEEVKALRAETGLYEGDDLLP